MTYKLLFLSLLVPFSALGDQQLIVGDGQIDGNRLKPFKHSWHQCSLVEGKWTGQNPVSEELLASGDDEWLHRQTVEHDSGARQVSDTYYDRTSFAPRRMETEVTHNGVRVVFAQRTISEDGYEGTLTQGDQSRELAGAINSSMLNGASMGLPLATLAFQLEPLEFMAAMMAFEGTYRVKATWSGKETLTYANQHIESWLVDVEWHHLESGDVYPAGPDASGGRYWIVPNPPEGFPNVPRYQTDTYSVEFIPTLCSLD